MPSQDPSATPQPGNEQARSQAVDDAAAADSNQPATVPEGSLPNSDQLRYPNPITLDILDEPPAPMPRTPSQEREDVDAAARVVDLASAQATNSDTLDNYFPRIKRRFGLVSLGYEGDFQTGFQIVGKLNPEFKRTATEPLSGTGLTSNLASGHITTITYEHSTLGGSQVGLSMLANPLGPDHDQGSGPTGQKKLMDQLPTDPKVISDLNARYVRGHLLNDNVGGRGVPMNLFPITAAANSEHERKIERFVKDWVNTRKLWIEYTVQIEARPQLESEAGGLKSIDSVIDAKAQALDTNLGHIAGLTKHERISSTYMVPAQTEAGAENDVSIQLREDLQDPLTQRLQSERPQDQAFEPPLSAAHRETTITFPGTVEIALKEAIGRRGTNWVKTRLRGHPGFGASAEEALFAAYNEVKRKADQTVTELKEAHLKGRLTWVLNNWDSALGPLIAAPR